VGGLPESYSPSCTRFFDDMAEALRRYGYVIVQDALPAGLVDNLFVHFKNLAVDEFRQAGIGKHHDYHVNGFVRGDAIAWLDYGTGASSDYLVWMDRLRLELNRRLFLGLFDFECHYAWYPERAFYRKHYDGFRGSTARIISSVLYLNPTWMPEDGGELILYSPRNDQVALEKVAPRYGKLVMFLSRKFPHEVLPVNKPRYSIAGWYRVNQSRPGAVDPSA